MRIGDRTQTIRACVLLRQAAAVQRFGAETGCFTHLTLSDGGPCRTEESPWPWKARPLSAAS